MTSPHQKSRQPAGHLLGGSLCRNKFDLDPHPHTGSQPLQGAKRRISVAALQLADVCLGNAGALGKLLLGQSAFLPGSKDRLDHSKFGVKSGRLWRPV